MRVLLVVSALFACTSACAEALRWSETLFDGERDRPIAIEIYRPSQQAGCTALLRCPVVILSAGYGISHTSYSFIASAMNEQGYLLVSVQHELASDPPLATSGDLFTARSPNWQRGAENIRFVIASLRDEYPGFKWDAPILVGHSNGGDISAWYVRVFQPFAGTLITLDHRRVPLPSSPRVLSVRAGDHQADAGVLPDDEASSRFGTCIVNIPWARHNDMHDGGPAALRSELVRLLLAFVASDACDDEKRLVPVSQSEQQRELGRN